MKKEREIIWKIGLINTISNKTNSTPLVLIMKNVKSIQILSSFICFYLKSKKHKRSKSILNNQLHLKLNHLYLMSFYSFNYLKEYHLYL